MKDREEWLARMIARLMPDEPRLVTLDEIGEVIGLETVGSDDVEALIHLLEKKGATIGDAEGQELVVLLKKVIQTAMVLRKEGKRPTPALIAQTNGLSPRAVRVALLYADVLKGGA